MRRSKHDHPRRRLTPTPAFILALAAVIIAIARPIDGGSRPAPRDVAYTTTSAHAARIHIPRNSVGSAQIKNHSIVTADIAPSTLRKLRGAKGDPGPQGPAGTPGPTTAYFAVVSGSGQIVSGPGATGTHQTVGSGSYTIAFPRDTSSCGATASSASIDNTPPPNNRAAVRNDGGKVGVQLTDASGNPVDGPFSVVVVCSS